MTVETRPGASSGIGGVSSVMSVQAGASGPGAGPVSCREVLGHGFAERLLDAFRDPAYFIDVRGRAVYWNQAASRFTGRPADEMLGRPDSLGLLGFADAAGVPLRPDDFPGMRSVREGRAVDRMLSLRRRDGERIPVEARCSPVRDDDGSIAGVLILLRDATSAAALELALREARRAAERDPLTGLANRRALDRMLDLRLRIQACEGRPFCMILADIDRFKSVNDGWGHVVGDRALTAFAELLHRQSRSEDLVARFGGEEFVILLPDASLEVAARVAERLRAATPEATPPELSPRRLSASFGVAEAELGETASQLLRRADAALYRAKAAGRDRIEVDVADSAYVPFARLDSPPHPDALRLGLPES